MNFADFGLMFDLAGIANMMARIEKYPDNTSLHLRVSNTQNTCRIDILMICSDSTSLTIADLGSIYRDTLRRKHIRCYGRFRAPSIQM